MSGLNVIKILHEDFVNNVFLRSEHFLNPFINISDLEKPITAEQKHHFNQCRAALVIQAQHTELHEYIARTPKYRKHLYIGDDENPTKAVKHLNMDHY